MGCKNITGDDGDEPWAENTLIEGVCVGGGGGGTHKER